MIQSIHITSDGTGRSTKIVTEDGTEIQGMCEKVVIVMEPDGIVRARLSMVVVKVDVFAQADLPNRIPDLDRKE